MKLLLSLSLAVSALAPSKADEMLVDVLCRNDFGMTTLSVSSVKVPEFVPGSPLMIIRSPDSPGSVLVNVTGHCLVTPSPERGLGELHGKEQEQAQ